VSTRNHVQHTIPIDYFSPGSIASFLSATVDTTTVEAIFLLPRIIIAIAAAVMHALLLAIATITSDWETEDSMEEAPMFSAAPIGYYYT